MNTKASATGQPIQHRLSLAPQRFGADGHRRHLPLTTSGITNARSVIIFSPL